MKLPPWQIIAGALLPVLMALGYAMDGAWRVLWYGWAGWVVGLILASSFWE